MKILNNSFTALSALILVGFASAFVPANRVSWVGPVRKEDSVVDACAYAWGKTSIASSVQSNDTNNRRPFNRRKGAGNGGGGGHKGQKGQTALKLENPCKVRRIAAVPPPRQERRPRNDAKGGDSRPKGRRPPGTGPGADAKGGDRKGGGSDAGGPQGARDGRRKPAKRKDAKYRADGGGDGRNNRRASLRIGQGGKKSRAASLTARRGSLRKRDRSAQKEAKEAAAQDRRTVDLPEGPVTVGQLAEIIDEKPVSIIKFLMTDLGVMAGMTQTLDPDCCIAVAEGFGKIVHGMEEEEEDDEDDEEDYDEDSALSVGFVTQEDDLEYLAPRAPVVTIMGHVDHGKTSLLDAIRNTAVTAGEAGGITQAIAAYQVDHNGDKITFIDTPGHAAFTDMRERGANITDIVILVVAADDGVKQQTADSIACARQAGVPLVVAINKCDLETADPNKVMTELTQYDILTEEFGGDILAAQISAKEGTGIEDLLDKIKLQAEVQNLKANPDRYAEAIIIEANVERGLGTVATTLIKKGTLRVGDIFAAGKTFGRVKALIDTNDGKTRLQEAGPSRPVRIVGFEGIPCAGDPFVVLDDEPTARTLAESRQRISRESASSSYQANLMDSVTAKFGSTKQSREICVVVKADVQGSAEALTRSLRELKLENDEAVVTVKVLVSEAGEISKSDIAVASVTPETTVIAFNVPASFAAMEDARAQSIPIEYYSIIYDAIETIESRMQEVLSPTPEGEYSGSAVVQEVFNIGGTGNIAGSRCNDGELRKGGNVRVMRGDKILIETKVKTLRNFKAEVEMIEAGNECGIGLIDFEDFVPGDIVECYVE